MNYEKEIRNRKKEKQKRLLSHDLSSLEVRVLAAAVDPDRFYALKLEYSDSEIVTMVTNDILNVAPDRYPKHSDITKGQVFGGECNRTACGSHDATWWNTGTKGLYCTQCAVAINGVDPNPICILVSEKPILS